MVVRMARRDGRDAVFDVPAGRARRLGPDDRVTRAALAGDPSVARDGPGSRGLAAGRSRDAAVPGARRARRSAGRPAARRRPCRARSRRRGRRLRHPGHGARPRGGPRPAVWVVDPEARPSRCARVQVDCATIPPPWSSPRASRPATSSSPPGVNRCKRRPDGASRRGWSREAFNLSDWALRHRSFVVYLMIVSVAAGLLAFRRLGPQRGPDLRHQDHGRLRRVARRHAWRTCSSR